MSGPVAPGGWFPDLSALKVLVVDDMSFCRTLVRNLLVAAGVKQVEMAAGVDQAARQIREMAPDLLVLDWELAERSGIDLLQMIRGGADGADPTIAVLMLTAYREEHRVRQAMSAGITSYLTKPFTAGDFLAKVRFCVENRHRHSAPSRAEAELSKVEDDLRLLLD
jgi:two-component system chemotaxis response regulator CheY